MKRKEETDLMAFGDCTFQITAANETMLSALSKHAQFLDYQVSKKGNCEQLNLDGLVNKILYDAMKRRINELVKEFGFDDVDDFIDVMAHCADGEEVAIELDNHTFNKYQKQHDEILSHIPMDSGQKELPFKASEG